MQFVAQKYPPAWLILARLFEESGLDKGIDRAKEAVGRYLEATPRSKGQLDAWLRLAEYCRLSEDWLGEIHSVVEISQLPDIPFDQLSNAANRLNNLLRFHQFLDIYDIKLQIRKLVDTLASRIDKEGDATDCSRLAWLYRRLGEQEAAALLIEQGLQMEPDNEYCLKLKASLSQQGGFVRQAAL